MTSAKLVGPPKRIVHTRRFDPVVGVVLAACGSTRRGPQKELARVGGRTIVERAVRAACACDAVVVVVGADAAAVRSGAEAANVPVTFALDVSSGSGLAASIQVGLDAALAVEPGLAAVAFLACDEPFVDRAHVELLVLAFRAGCAPIVASGYAKDGGLVVGIPTLFGRSVFGELRALSGDCGMRSVIAMDASRVATVPISAGAIDVDTEDEGLGSERVNVMRASG